MNDERGDTSRPPGHHRWIPRDWRTRVVVGVGALVVGVMIAVAPEIVTRIWDAADAGPRVATDTSAPFVVRVNSAAFARSHAYALTNEELAADPSAHAQISAGDRPSQVTPIDDRLDAWVIRAAGTEPITILNITAVSVATSAVDDGVYVEYGQGGTGGDGPPTHNLTVDLDSGDSLTSVGERAFDEEKIVVRSDRSTYFNFSVVASEPRRYSWLLRFSVETAEGVLSDVYAGPSGELHTDAESVPATDRFVLTGRAASYTTTYLPGADGLPQISTSVPMGAADSAAVPPELTGNWCPRAGDGGCVDFSAIVRQHPSVSFEASAPTDTGTVSYSLCLNGLDDCITATTMYVDYFPPGAVWDCIAEAAPTWKGCSPDYTSAHDPTQPRIVVRPSHQQGESFFDTAPLYRTDR